MLEILLKIKNKNTHTHIQNDKIFKRENVIVELVYNNKIIISTDLIWENILFMKYLNIL